jgi:hypothetical protein
MLMESNLLALVEKKVIAIILFVHFLLFLLSILLTSVQLTHLGDQN